MMGEMGGGKEGEGWGAGREGGGGGGEMKDEEMEGMRWERRRGDGERRVYLHYLFKQQQCSLFPNFLRERRWVWFVLVLPRPLTQWTV